MMFQAISNVVGLNEDNVGLVLAWNSFLNNGDIRFEKGILIVEHYWRVYKESCPYLGECETLELAKAQATEHMNMIIEENENILARVLKDRWGNRIVERLRQHKEIDLPSLEDKILNL